MYSSNNERKNLGGNEYLPLVSVIMPCYNHGQYVGKAIEAILNQTYPNIELIVADNGCTDNSYEVIRQYRDKIKIIRLEKNNQKLCGELMIAEATGEYLAYATADDEWESEKIELQMKAFFSIPNLQVCFTWALYADENMHIYEDQSRNVFIRKNRTRGEWLKYFFYMGNCLCFPSALFKKDVNEQIRKNSRGYVQLSDFYYWISLLQLGEIYVVEKAMVKFRWHISGENANSSAPSIENAIRGDREYVDIVLQIAENVEDNLFKEAFEEEFINCNAQTHEELLCERFFLLKRRAERTPIFSDAALDFYYNHYLEIADLLQSQYGFSDAHYRELAGNSGSVYSKAMLDMAQSANEMMRCSLSAYREMALKFAGECYQVGGDNGRIKGIFALMPEYEQENLRDLYGVCKDIRNWVSKHGHFLDILYFELMRLIVNAYELMNAMRLQLKLLGIMLDDEEFELFGRLIQFGKTEKIDLLEAVVPYIEMTAEQLGEIVN